MLKDLLKQSRSYRSFDPNAKITEEQLLEWVDHARYCPSSINLQMLKFRLVTDASECKAVLSDTRWAGKIKDTVLPPQGHAPVAYIVICSDSTVIPSAESFQKDVGICAQTLMLAASESGYGGCMIGSFSAQNLQKILSLPLYMVPQLILALGRPDEQVKLAEEAADGSVTYYRENGIHYVQKRSLEHLIVKP